MNKTQISKEIIRYSFDPEPGHHLADNIYALVSGEKALLIDIGYDYEGSQIGKDLTDRGLELTVIIISHFHDDHMQGLRTLPRVPVSGASTIRRRLICEKAYLSCRDSIQKAAHMGKKRGQI